MSVCPNCEGGGVKAYCPKCGQEQTDVLPTVREWAADLFDELFMLNGKIPQSYRLLLTPGALTEEWVAGRRAKYLRPFRLYLLTLAVVILIGSADGGGDEAATGGEVVVRALAVFGIPMLGVVSRFTLGLHEGPRSVIPHLVFSLHQHTFMFLLLVPLLLAELVWDAAAVGLGEGVFEVFLGVGTLLTVGYFLLAARRVYATGPVRTVVVGLIALQLYSLVAGASFFLAVQVLS